MPAKKAVQKSGKSKAKPVTKPSAPEDRPTPRVEPEPQPTVLEVPATDTKSAFVKNYLWPTVMGLAAALVTALTTGLPNILADGLQPGDWPQIGGVLLAAAVGYFANILTRYGGKGSPWVAPPVEPQQ